MISLTKEKKYWELLIASFNGKHNYLQNYFLNKLDP